jgi:hypothetical protein
MTINNRLYQRTTVKGPSQSQQQPNVKVYKGFSTVSDATENFGLYDLALIKQDIINHFYIRKGEKLMNPDFGTVIWDLLFEQFTEEVKKLISENNYKTIDIGASLQFWSYPECKFVADIVKIDKEDVKFFDFNIQDKQTWGELLDYVEQHPRPEQIYLVVEVVDSTLKQDCQIKDKLYAKAGIADYWVLAPQKRHLHIFRKPTPTGYTEHQKLSEPSQASPLAFPDFAIALTSRRPPSS